jgi:sugar phosphate isomerase/epimerase
MDRREFLKTSLVAAGAVAGLGAGGQILQAADAPKGKAVLKLCSQDGKIPGKSLKEKAELILKFGGCGLEFGGMSAERAKQIKQDLAGTGVGVAALCWGRFSLMDSDAEKRKKAVEDLKKALEVAAEAGSTGVIVVPNPQMPFEDGLKILADVLPAVGEHGVKVGNRVLLEPLCGGEAKFMNRLEQAVAICKASKSPGICLMGDFYHMCKEEKDDEQAFITADGLLHHIHLASRIRWLPGQDHLREPDKPERSFVSGFKGLKKIGYQDYCSLECNTNGDKKNPSDPMVEIPKSFAFLKAQWDEANV